MQTWLRLDRALRRGLPRLLLAAGLVAAAVAAAAPVPDDPRAAAIVTYDLGAAGASVLPGGEIVLLDPAGARLLTIRPITPRPDGIERAFAGLFVEGEPGGRRGLDADADDDGDGRADEDPANGMDDDGDGRRDEDYAAIGEAMAVVDLAWKGIHLHQETYHWSYPHLRRGLAVHLDLADARGDAAQAGVLAVAAGGAWWIADLHLGAEAFDRDGTAAATAFVLRLPGDGGREPLWLGISPLRVAASEERRPVAAGARLELPVTGALELALALAPTRLQLSRQLAAAHRVRLGVPDGAGGRMAWTIPPLCRICLAGERPAASWSRQADGWSLSLHVRPGQDALIDPDRLHAAGRPLPAPERIEWRPEAEDGTALPGAWSVFWSKPAESLSADDLLPGLYEDCPELLRHTGRGTLILSYRDEPPWLRRSAAAVLSGEGLTGRPFDLPLPPGRTSPGSLLAGGARESRPSASAVSPQLRPDLLRNHPNPFTDRTLFTFRVPATVGEAFLPDMAALLGGPERPLAEGGVPLVTLKVYDLGGAEVAELRSGWLTPGRYEAGWDGNDRFGHPVAAGTYFCKLQIDGWSVTKRVAFMR